MTRTGSAGRQGTFDSATGQPLKVMATHERDVSGALLQRALAQGDREVVIKLCWNLFNQPLFLRIVATGIPPDQAEDVLQDVFSLLHREYDAVCGPKLGAWLWTMADYECLRHIQASQRVRRGREALVAGPGQTGFLHGPARPDVLAEQRGSLRAAVAFLLDLPPWEAALLKGTFLEDRSDQETIEWISSQFGRRLTLRQLACRRHRLRRRLAKHLAGTDSGRGQGEGP